MIYVTLCDFILFDMIMGGGLIVLGCLLKCVLRLWVASLFLSQSLKRTVLAVYSATLYVGEAVLKRVLGLEGREPLPHRRVERVVRRRHGKELRVAAPTLWDDDAVEDGAEGRARAEGHVGVPLFDQRWPLRVVLEDRQLWVALHVRVRRVQLHTAKALRQIAMVTRLEGVLVAKEEDLVLEERLAYCLKLWARERIQSRSMKAALACVFSGAHLYIANLR